MKKFLHDNGAWLALFALFIIFTIVTSGSFLSDRNLTNLLRQAAINGILACGMTFVIITGGIDLSIGSIVALSGILIGMSQVSLLPPELGYLGAVISLLIGVFAGAGAGAINGVLISSLGIAPFVITLGMMVVARGLALIISNGGAIAPMTESFSSFASSYFSPLISTVLLSLLILVFVYIHRKKLVQSIFPTIFLLGTLVAFYKYKGMPALVIFLALTALISSFLLNYTVWGRSVFAIGSNIKAAYWSGVAIRKTQFLTYLYMGALSGLAGGLLTSRLNGASPTAGGLFELDAIAAVVIGGTRLTGGSGSIMGSIVGALMMATLNNGMDLLSVPDFYQMVFKGIIIVGAVALDRTQRQVI